MENQEQPKAQIQIQIPQVPLADAANFAKVWTFNGITIPMQDAHIKFASDYANIVLRNFVMQAALANVQRAQAAALEAKPKLIVEGIDG